MHRDVKLGLALGILVIGFAAAFCFPRQTATELAAVNPATGLKLAAVDQEIRLERRRTFVGEELTPPEQPTLADPLPASVTINPDLPPLQTASRRAHEALKATPDPIRRDVPIPPGEENLASTGLTAFPSLNETTVDTAPPADDVFYTVQSGDTLSGVAAKTLGTTRKYEAIYEANRDVLATPNSLRIGMKLRIPQAAESIAKRTTPTRSPNADRIAARPDSPNDNSVPIRRSGLFSPVGRSRIADQHDNPPR